MDDVDCVDRNLGVDEERRSYPSHVFLEVADGVHELISGKSKTYVMHVGK